MSRCVVTGVAGFIGSHLCEALLAKGYEVHGVDAFIPYYPREVKEANLLHILNHGNFTFQELDLRTADLGGLLENKDIVFHLAAMPGLIKSWSDFQLYSTCNTEATEHLLEAACNTEINHFIYGSTSSVYGQYATGPENSRLHPFSPYGITKLASEHLCWAYAANFSLPVTVLRYFSVYGPRQRPDMAYNIMIRCLLKNEIFPLFGDGAQSRSNTFIKDVVEATMLAHEYKEEAVGQTFNIGGGQEVTLNEIILMLQDLTHSTLQVDRHPPRPGDQKRTVANIEKARSRLGYHPATKVIDGLRAQVEWQKM